MNLKKIDAIFSFLAIPFAYALRALFFFKQPSKKILMVRPGGMGDLIALTHALRELQLSPDSYHWLIEKRSEPWAQYLKLNYSCYDRNPIRTLLKHISKFSEVINTEQRFGLSQVYALACKHPEGRLTSFSTNRLAFLAHNKAQYNPRKNHEVLSFARIFNPHMLLGPLMKTPSNKDSEYSIIWIAGGNSPSRTMLTPFGQLDSTTIT